MSARAPEVFGAYLQVTREFVNDLIKEGYPYDENDIRGSVSERNAKLRTRLEELLQFELGSALKGIRDKEMRQGGLEFRSYLLPLTFFLFTFFASWLTALPLINSVFTGDTQTVLIPLFNTGKSIPLLVIQWGFLGGLVYTSINLLRRFLRRDLVPHVYFMASLRLLLAIVAAVVIYFFYMLSSPDKPIDTSALPPQILLLVFVAGIAPVQILSHFANVVLSRIENFSTKNKNAGDESLRILSGIDYVTMDRLNEEGIDTVSHLALCNPIRVSTRTHFPVDNVIFWKEQALLYMLTANIKCREDTLYEVLVYKNGIQTWSTFNAFVNHFNLHNVGYTQNPEQENDVLSFFKQLGLESKDDEDYYYYKDLLLNLQSEGFNLLVRIPSGTSLLDPALQDNLPRPAGT